MFCAYDFFVSYTTEDEVWGETIARVLRSAGYRIITQKTFKKGRSFVDEMDRAGRSARKTLAVLSPAYFDKPYTTAEWVAALSRKRLLPIRVREYATDSPLNTIIYLDLAGLNAADPDAERRILEQFGRARAPRCWRLLLMLTLPTFAVVALFAHATSSDPLVPADGGVDALVPRDASPSFDTSDVRLPNASAPPRRRGKRAPVRDCLQQCESSAQTSAGNDHGKIRSLLDECSRRCDAGTPVR